MATTATLDSQTTLIQSQPDVTTPKVSIKANLGNEYVAGGDGLNWLPGAYLRALPPYIDDVTADFGPNFYERMMLDSKANSSVNDIKLAILAQGYKVQSVIGDNTHPEYPIANEIAQFVDSNVRRLRKPSFRTTLDNLLDASYLGHKVAEKTYYRDTSGVNIGKICLQSVKVKPNLTVSFIVDVYYNVVAVLGTLPGTVYQNINWFGAWGLTPETLPANALPRDKFIIYSFKPKDNNPLGTSLLRAAYTAWWIKTQTIPEYTKYLAQFASPSLIGELSPDAEARPVYNADGTPLLDIYGQQQRINPSVFMEDALRTFRNGSYMVLPNGASVSPLASTGDGSAFVEAFSQCDLYIVEAITGQSLATQQGQHQSRAASDTHQDVLDTLILSIKEDLQTCIKEDLFYQLVYLNYGRDAAERYTPDLIFPGLEHQDFAANATAIALLMDKGYLDPSQFEKVDLLLGLPARDPNSIQQAIEAKQVRFQMQQQALINSQTPPVQPTNEKSNNGGNGDDVETDNTNKTPAKSNKSNDSSDGKQ